jgi:hypothetical protein
MLKDFNDLLDREGQCLWAPLVGGFLIFDADSNPDVWKRSKTAGF